MININYSNIRLCDLVDLSKLLEKEKVSFICDADKEEIIIKKNEEK